MSSIVSTEVRLVSRPRGWPAPENFALARVEVPAPAAGQVLVRNLYMSVDPYMRGRMNDVKSYVPPFQIGQPLEGGAVGEVIASEAPGLSPGDIVTSARGWRQYFIAGARDVVRVPDPVTPVSVHLGALGMTGLTAWIGLKLIDLQPGERVFVSGAAGAVGSVAGQLAKIRGCFVVGSAGSDEKVSMLTRELTFDAAFSYRDGSLLAKLRDAAPDGLDVYFDNVGGDHLEAALAALRLRGRIVACGSISGYNAESPVPGPRNLFLMVTKRLTMRGFIVLDWFSEMPAFVNEMRPHLAEGRLRVKETVVEGIERAPEAFIGLLRGANVGKMVVKLA
jgi:NADPH-dependent curcumin reductase CurA